LESRRSQALLTFIIIALIAVLLGFFWANYHFSKQVSGGESFLPRWLGTRLFLTEGISPYGEQATAEIQNLRYGRLARSNEDQSLFLYPFYSILVFSPFSLVKDFMMARALWMTVLEAALIGLLAISVSLSGWRISLLIWTVLLFLGLCWYYSVSPLISGDASILCSLFIALSLIAIRSGNDVFAGFFLALASIKPQMVLVLGIFVLLWAAANNRWLLFWSPLGSLAVMVAATSLILPNWWVFEELKQIIVFAGYSQGGTPGAVIKYWLPGIGNQMGWVTTVFVAGILLWEWRTALRQDFSGFFWTACLTLVLSNFIGIRTSTQNYVSMLPALILIIAVWDERWGNFGRLLTAIILLILFFGIWAVFISGQGSGFIANLDPTLFFLLPTLTVVGLYWVRWWAIRPPRLPLEEFSARVG
jgi:hypothetical protein